MSSQYSAVNGNHKTDTLTSHHEGVERVIQVMNERLDGPLTLQDMADIAMFSPYHFNRVFRHTTGIPPAQFLYALRLQEAKRLLLTTQGSVTDICFEVGYNSLGTFTRRFTELVGLSPTRLRCLYNDPCLFASELLRDYAKYPHYEGPRKCNLIGRVSTPATFSGLIFVGLFPTQIPQSQPVACTFLATPGAYSIASVPKGSYFVFATAYGATAYGATTYGATTYGTTTYGTTAYGATAYETPPYETSADEATAYKASACSATTCTYSLAPTYVGVGQEPLLIENNQTPVHIDIALSSTQLTDPPILLATPYLFAKHLGDYFKMGGHAKTGKTFVQDLESRAQS